MGIFDLYRKINNVNGISIQEELLNEEIENFETYLYNSPNYYQINKYNGNTIIDCTIQDVSFNNKTSGDEKILCTQVNENIIVGDVVQWHNKNWIIISEEENTIQSHKTFIMRPCNNALKYILPSNHTQIISIPCISSNMSLYSIGLNESKQLVTQDGKKFCIIPYSIITKEIYVGQRFLFWDKQAFEVTEISYDKANEISGIKSGILEIKMQQSQIRPEDNLNSLVAFNEGISLETPIITNDLVINGEREIYLNTSKTYTVTNADGTPTNMTFTFSIDNDNLVTITSFTDISCTLKANSSLKGYMLLTVKCVEDPTIILTKNIYVRSLI